MSDEPQGQEAEAPAPAPAPAPGKPAVNKAEFAEIENDLKRMENHFAGQKRVEIKVQEDTYVAVNGYGFQIQGKTRVKVPEQVRDILEEAGRI